MIKRSARKRLIFLLIILLGLWAKQSEARTYRPPGVTIPPRPQESGLQESIPQEPGSKDAQFTPTSGDLSASPETTPQSPGSQTSAPQTQGLPGGAQPTLSSPWLRSGNAKQRLSIGIELGGGLDLPMAPMQGFFEGNLSLGLYFYDNCASKGKTPCLRFYALLPQIGSGYYFNSQFPFIQASVGLGMEIGVKPWFAWFFQSGIGGKFSFMGPFNDQQARGVDGFSVREPADAQMLYGFFQTGASFQLSAAKGISLQVSAKIANGPSMFGFWQDVLDLGFFLGLRFRLGS